MLSVCWCIGDAHIRVFIKPYLNGKIGKGVAIVAISAFMGKIDLDEDLFVEPRLRCNIDFLVVPLKLGVGRSFRSVARIRSVEGKDGIEDNLRIAFEFCNIEGDFSAYLVFRRLGFG